jgi:hypothetical protein
VFAILKFAVRLLPNPDDGDHPANGRRAPRIEVIDASTRARILAEARQHIADVRAGNYSLSDANPLTAAELERMRDQFVREHGAKSLYRNAASGQNELFGVCYSEPVVTRRLRRP